MNRITIVNIGPNKVKVLKIIREATGWGLKESSDFLTSVENQGSQTLDLLDEQDLASVALQLEGEGATVSYIHDSGSENTSLNNDNSMKYDDTSSIDLPTINMINPDSIANIDRNSLLAILRDIRKLTGTIDGLYNRSSDLTKDIERERIIAEEIKNKKPGWVWGLSILVGFVLGIVFVSMLSWIGFLFGLIGGSWSVHELLEAFDKLKNKDKREKMAIAYLEEKLPPIQNEIIDNQLLIDRIMVSKEVEWARDIVGTDMFYSDGVDELISYVQSRRADTLKEALNKYDSSQHVNKMEEMQRSIQNAVELTAQEAVKQTAYAKATEENSHRAATAAQASAYHTRQIYKNIKKK